MPDVAWDRQRVKMNGTMESSTPGRLISLINPSPTDCWLDDLAHGLSMECRFGRRTNEFYSVAEHSVLVHDCVLADTGDMAKAKAALFHDGSESYLGDWPAPLKPHISPDMRDLASRWDDIVEAVFDIIPGYMHHPDVKRWDRICCVREGEVLMNQNWGKTFYRDYDLPLPDGVQCMFGLTWRSAKRVFLMRARMHGLA